MARVEESAENVYEAAGGKSRWADRLPPPGPVDVISLTGFGLHGTYTREELDELENRPNILFRFLSGLARQLRFRPPQSR